MNDSLLKTLNKKTTSRLQTILRHLRKSEWSSVTSPSLNECAASLPVVRDKDFQYTLNCSYLTRVQRQFYEDNGYIVIKKLVDDNLLDLCRDRFVDICNGVTPLNGMFLMKEPTLLKAGATGERLFYKLQDFLHDDVLFQYSSSPQLLDYIQCFTGPNITAIHSMLINKPPDAEETTIHPLHQDLLYFPFRPTDLIVGTWTAMERVDVDNGCLVVVPGSHKGGQLLAHSTEHFQTGPYKTFFGVKNVRNAEPIPIIMEKGDTIFLHPLIIHGSGPNRSKRFRKAISTHYAASECSAIDVHNTVQDETARAIESTALKMSGMPLDFTTIMKLRCVVVRGSEGFTAE